MPTWNKVDLLNVNAFVGPAPAGATFESDGSLLLDFTGGVSDIYLPLIRQISDYAWLEFDIINDSAVQVGVGAATLLTIFTYTDVEAQGPWSQTNGIMAPHALQTHRIPFVGDINNIRFQANPNVRAKVRAIRAVQRNSAFQTVVDPSVVASFPGWTADLVNGVYTSITSIGGSVNGQILLPPIGGYAYVKVELSAQNFIFSINTGDGGDFSSFQTNVRVSEYFLDPAYEINPLKFLGVAAQPGQLVTIKVTVKLGNFSQPVSAFGIVAQNQTGSSPATSVATSYLIAQNNLSDLTNKPQALINLGIVAVGTGLIPAGYLGTGAADNTKFLRGDGVWAPGIGDASGIAVTPNSDLNVAKWLRWQAGGIGKVIIDASSGIAPGAVIINSTTPDNPWAVGQPNLMGWDGAHTWGVRVEHATNADNVALAATATNATNFGGQLPSFYAPRNEDRKNIFINGGFTVAQRATSAAITTAVTYNSIDRWFFQQPTSALSTASQIATSASPGGALNGYTNCLQVQRTAGSALTNAIFAGQVFISEDSSKFAGKTVTISFWACKGANFSAGGNNLFVNIYYGTGQNQGAAAFIAHTWTGQTVLVNNLACVLTAVWTQYSLTFAVPANATQLGFYSTFVPTGVAGAADLYCFTGARLAEETVAGIQEFHNHRKNLEDCRWFYRRTTSQAGSTLWLASGGIANSATNCIFSNFTLGANMRTLPILRVSANADFQLFNSGGTVCTGIAIAQSLDSPQLNVTVAAGLTANSPYHLILSAATAKFIELDAELL